MHLGEICGQIDTRAKSHSLDSPLLSGDRSVRVRGLCGGEVWGETEEQQHQRTKEQRGT